MSLTQHEIRLVSVWALKQHGLWDEVKRRFGVEDGRHVVRMFKGTQLGRKEDGTFKVTIQ